LFLEIKIWKSMLEWKPPNFGFDDTLTSITEYAGNPPNLSENEIFPILAMCSLICGRNSPVLLMLWKVGGLPQVPGAFQHRPGDQGTTGKAIGHR
jgi:hypothetical protein